MEIVRRTVRFFESFVDRMQYEDPSGDGEFLLAPGHIEQLIQEGRIPVKIGYAGPPGGEKLSMYQIPPKLKFGNICDVYRSDLDITMVFVNERGGTSLGSTYTLTSEQETLFESRIKAEEERMALIANSRK